jgi:hypothetical protein
VIKTVQSLANDTNYGITIMVPVDSAFAAIDLDALSNFTIE